MTQERVGRLPPNFQGIWLVSYTNFIVFWAASSAWDADCWDRCSCSVAVLSVWRYEPYHKTVAVAFSDEQSTGLASSGVLLNMEVVIHKRAWHTRIRYTLLIYDHWGEYTLSKNPEVGIRRIPAYICLRHTMHPQYVWFHCCWSTCVEQSAVILETRLSYGQFKHHLKRFLFRR